MTSLAVGSVLVVCMVLAGWGPMRRFAPRDLGWLGRFGWSAAVGAALTGQVQILLGLLGVAATAGVPIGLAVVSTGWALSQRAAHRASLVEVEPLPVWVRAAFALVVVASTSVSAGLPFTSDGTKFWAPRAREMVEHAAIEMPTLHDEARVGFHRRYPLLVPAVMAPAFEHSPQDAMVGPKLTLQIFTIALLAFLTDRLGRTGPRGRALLVALLAMPTWSLVKVRESAVAAGYVDAVIALWLVLIVDAVLARDRSGRTLASMAFFAAAAWATKFEGIVTVAVLLIAWLLSRPRDFRAIVTVLVGAAVLAVPTVIIQQSSIADAPIGDIGLLANLDVLAGRSVPVVAGFVGRLLDITAFGFLPLLLVAWLPAAWFARVRPSDTAFARRLSIWLVLGVLGWFASIYLVTTMNVTRHIYTSGHRLLLQWLPALTLTAAVIVEHLGRPASED